MELPEFISVLGGIAVLLTLQGFWISRALGRVETVVDAFKAEVHTDMAAHTEALADLRERVARIEA